MFNRNRRTNYFGSICLVATLLGTPAYADDLSDAKSAYGAGQFEEAATLLRPLVRQENIEAVYLLARMYEQGDGVEKDLEEAKRLFRLAAENGNDAAQQRLDIFDAQGADDSVVIEWYLPSAEEGDTEAQYNLGFMYETGWGVLVNESEAVRWYREAAEMHHDVAQLRLGMMLIVGVGEAKSINNGLILLRRSAENGNRIAEALVQDLFDSGDVETDASTRIVAGIRRVLDEGERATLDTLRKSLELLHQKPEPIRRASIPEPIKTAAPKPKQVDVVKAVTGSKPVEKKTTKTKAPVKPKLVKTKEKSELHAEDAPVKGDMFHWYLNNANQGDADAQYHAGVMYIKGDQVEVDVDEGVRWIKLSAEQGHEMGTIYMELWNDSFSENSFDSSIAVRWLKDAGRSFNLDAIFNLAFMYETGRGVKKNFNTAKRWYKFAAVEGHAEAKRRLALLKKNNSTPDGIASSQEVEVVPDVGVIAALVAALLACVGGYFYYRRRNGGGVSMPAMEIGDHEVISQAKNSQGLQVDDRKFFDELWDSSSPVEAAAGKSSKPKSSDKKSSGAESKDKTPSVAEKEKSPELSEVEKKLAKAIDDLMEMGGEQKPATKDTAGAKPKEESTPPPVEVKKPEGNVENNVAKIDDKPDKKAAEKETIPEEKSDKKVVMDGQIAASKAEFGADSFLSNGISMDELAASRVSADNLFADGVAIDEAGKAVGRGGYNPQKLDANDVLNIDDLSAKDFISGGSISNFSPRSRPVGPAASLLPKRDEISSASTFDEDILSAKDIESRPPEPLDITAPMTNDEERSLAEVHFNIGVMFSSGDGVPQNEAQAAKWFLKAAEEGMPEAQFNIGQCYLLGNGVQKDSTLAMEWIQKAADNNYKPAQEELQKKNRAS